MNHKLSVLVSAAVAALLLRPPGAEACTNYLITKGATADGSTMITYSADSFDFYGELVIRPATRNRAGTMIDIHDWDGGKFLGRISQVAQTYSVVGHINEHQLSIGETTWHGREELENTEGIIDYGSLMFLALERAKTAREAIKIMTDLVAEYGYRSSGESFSIADPKEVWILEMIGKGKGRKGAVWVARKIPDGYISAHSNSARIRQFPLNDPDTIYSPDVISFAREKGFFKGPDAKFDFGETYAPGDFTGRRFCDARVWCMFRRAAPSVKIGAAWVQGSESAEPMPLWVKPDKKLTVADVMGLMRDHYEGTELDMTQDVGAGPYQLPYRSRPLVWKVDGKEYINERPVSVQQTGFSLIAQMRGWLPAPIGGVLWFGVDDTFSTAYFPAYAGITRAPYNFARGTGSFRNVTWDSAFWMFNLVSNFSYLRYGDMIKDVQVAQREVEGRFLGEQAEIDSAAVSLYKQSPQLARDYLTKYSSDAGTTVYQRWSKLSQFLLYKYLDGTMKDDQGKVTFPGYPESWYRKVADTTGDRLRHKPLKSELAREEEAKKGQRKMADAIFALLEARRLPIDAATRKQIETFEDPAVLEKTLVRAAVVTAARDVIQ